MNVTLTLNDFSVVSHDVHLEITLKSATFSVRTSKTISANPINLVPGVPKILSASSLEAYMAPRYLDISGKPLGFFDRTLVLPEGNYQFCVQAFDFRRRTVSLSQKRCAVLWLKRSSPPRLIMPRDRAEVDRGIAPVTIFQWLPRHNTANWGYSRYRFELYESPVPGRDPRNAVFNTKPIYTEETSQNQIIYGPDKPALRFGMDYAWRVVVVGEGTAYRFTNQGATEIYRFKIVDKSPMNAPQFTKNEAFSASEQHLYWNAVPKAKHYVLEYKTTDDDLWTPNIIENNTAFAIENLDKETEYQVRIKAVRNTDNKESAYTSATFTTISEAEEESCSEADEDPKIEELLNHKTPLPALKVGDVVTVGGDMSMDILEVTGGNGIFSGRGAVYVLFLNLYVECEFENIRVNDRYFMYKGVVKAIRESNDYQQEYDQVEADVPTFDVEYSLTEMLGEMQKVLSGQYGEIDAETQKQAEQLMNDARETLQLEQKTEQKRQKLGTLPPKSNEAKALKQEINQAEKDIKNRSKDLNKRVNAMREKLKDREPVKTSSTPVYFSALEPFNTFDMYEDGKEAFISEYDVLGFWEDPYQVSWKSLSWGEKNQVDVGHHNIDSTLKFETHLGQPLELNDRTLSLPASAPGEGFISAYRVDTSGKQQLTGKLNTVMYRPKTIKLFLIHATKSNMNPAFLRTQVQEVQKTLNDIYRPAGISFDVQLIEHQELGDDLPYRLDNTYEKNTNLISLYPNELKPWLKQIKDLPDYDKEAYYMYFGDSKSYDVAGFMPKTGTVGFCFNCTNLNRDDQKTIAHEIGHGAFTLDHLANKQTPNLMNYTNSTALFKPQWDNIQNPSGRFNLDNVLQDVEEGEYTSLTAKQFRECYDNLSKTETPQYFLDKTTIPELEIQEISTCQKGEQLIRLSSGLLIHVFTDNDGKTEYEYYDGEKWSSFVPPTDCAVCELEYIAKTGYNNVWNFKFQNLIDDQTLYETGFLYGALDFLYEHKEIINPETYRQLMELSKVDSLWQKLQNNIEAEYESIAQKWGQNAGYKGYYSAKALIAGYEVFTLYKAVIKGAKNIGKWATKANKVVKGGARFIAQSGDELKTFLNGITDLPAGKTYNGNMYRYKTTGASYSVTDINPTMNPLRNRFKKGLYTSRSKKGNRMEAIENNNNGTNGVTQYEITNVQVDNLLDLTDESTIQKLGTSFAQMKLSGVDNKYEYTHVIADWAKSKGYSGVRFYGAQGVDEVYENFIIFEQSTVNNAIINSSIDDIPW